jgi:hypothetical protein
MTRSRNDHEIKFMGDAELYLALKSLADDDDRSFSDYLRHVLKEHVRAVVSASHPPLTSTPAAPIAGNIW